MRAGRRAKQGEAKPRGPTLFDFMAGGGEKRAEGRAEAAQAKAEARPAKSEGELLQRLMELLERHPKCFKREEVAMELGISAVLAVKLLNELAQVKAVRKRLNDDGGLVYCPQSGQAG